jgi:hypothetical protein
MPTESDDSLFLALLGLGLAVIIGDVIKLTRRVTAVEDAHNRTVFDQMNRDFLADRAADAHEKIAKKAAEKAEGVYGITDCASDTPKPTAAKPRGPRTGNVTKSA